MISRRSPSDTPLFPDDSAVEFPVQLYKIVSPGKIVYPLFNNIACHIRQRFHISVIWPHSHKFPSSHGSSLLADQGIQSNRHFHLCRITARHHGTDLIQIRLHFKTYILRQYTGLNYTGKRDHHTGNIQGQMVILINIENMHIRHTLCPYTFFRQFQTVHPDFRPWMTKLQNPGMFSRHAHLSYNLHSV